ncbi:DUF421 domain-containing protein [Flavobacterium succinicans]|uniref:YetF C-terminal domain-containing protein n=1 Tax=Flavobacterium succinicans TaxID=29536 RepID=A0A199XN68_9FLAO|nr:YetF domain-containing protein [Flavobacterium succinicans]OAZ02867.1 hypothetical protein FLB_28450 [Flavobacterium succinicans]
MNNPYFDVIFRSVAVYAFMIVALRIFGKKQLSQLNTADVILILLISNSVQNAMVGSNVSLIGGILAALSLFVMNLIFKKLVFKSEWIKNWIQDKPEILVHNGKIEFETVAKLGITSEELEEVMREHGIEHFRDIKLAILEIDGDISMISGDNALRQTHHKRKIHKSLGEVGE